jgi:hypothetical protein
VIAVNDDGDVGEAYAWYRTKRLSNFRRRLTVGGRTADVEKAPHEVIWNSAQTHVGENTGTTDTKAIFVELK